MDRIIKQKKWNLRKLSLYIGVPLLAISLLGLMVRNAGVTKYKVPKSRLTIATVSEDVFQEFIPLAGEVMPGQTVFIDAIEGGQVEKIYLQGGEIVKEGELILKLSSPSMELSYMNITTSLLEQLNNLRNSRITLEENALNLNAQLLVVQNQIDNLYAEHTRNEILMKDSVIPTADYIEVKNNYENYLKRRDLLHLRLRKDSMLKDQQLDQVESSMELIQQNLVAVKKNLGNLTIKAPVSGQMSSIRVERGETVKPGQKLGQIDILDGGYMVRAKVDEHYNGRVFKGQKGSANFQQSKLELIIKKVYPEVTDGTFEVDMAFTTKLPAEIKRGQNLQIRLALSDEMRALMIPKGGFYQASGGQYIFVLDESGTVAHKRENLQIGRQSDRFYEVLSGLTAGEQVIISNYDSYKTVDQLILLNE